MKTIPITIPIIITAILSISCSPNNPHEKPKSQINKTIVSKGDKVSVYYKGSYPDGTIFDERQEYSKPMTFIAGAGMMIPGFDNAVIGMKVGQEKKIVLKPSNAYGEYKKELLKKVKKNQLRKGFIPKIGDRIRYPDGKGSYKIFPIVKIKNSHVILDLNHPMAGKTLIFSIKIDKIE